jgi:hypothetical protein
MVMHKHFLTPAIGVRNRKYGFDVISVPLDPLQFYLT